MGVQIFVLAAISTIVSSILTGVIQSNELLPLSATHTFMCSFLTSYVLMMKLFSDTNIEFLAILKLHIPFTKLSAFERIVVYTAFNGYSTAQKDFYIFHGEDCYNSARAYFKSKEHLELLQELLKSSVSSRLSEISRHVSFNDQVEVIDKIFQNYILKLKNNYSNTANMSMEEFNSFVEIKNSLDTVIKPKLDVLRRS